MAIDTHTRESVPFRVRTADGDTVFTPGLAGLVLGEYRRLATTATAPQVT